MRNCLNMRWPVLLVLAGLLQACGGKSEADSIGKAKAAIEAKDPRTAVVALKAALQKQPDSPEGRFLLGKVLLDMDQRGPALVELSKARELGHPDAAVLPLLVRATALAGRPEQATTQFASTTLDDPAANAELKTAVALAWGFQGKRQEMQAALQDALKSNPNHSRAKIMNARFVAERGDFEAATRSVQEVIQADPKYAEAWQLMGMLTRVVKNDRTQALVEQRKALSLDPTLLSAHSEVLSMLYDAGDRKAMREQINQLQRALPDSPSTYLFRAQLEYLENNLKLARELVQQLLSADTTDPRVLLLAAQLEFRAGAFTVAETHLVKLLGDTPKHFAGRHLLASTQLRMGQATKALSTLQPLVDAPKPHPEALALAAQAFLSAGDTTRAEEYFQRAAKIAPDDPRLKTVLALNRIAKGQADAGIAQLESITQTDASSFSDLALISAALSRKQFDAALKAVDQLEKKQADAPLPHVLRARILLATGKADAARASFEKALAKDSTHFDAISGLVNLDVGAKKHEDATKRVDALLKADPKNHLGMLLLAELRIRQGMARDKIRPLLADAVNAAPQEAAPRQALIEFYLAGGEFKSAVTAAQEALASFPNNPLFFDAQGRAQIGAREYQQALSSFRRVASLLPKSPQPHLRMAETHELKGEPDAAVQSLRRALELDPNLLAAQVHMFRLAVIRKDHKQALDIARQLQRNRSKDGVGYLLEANAWLDQKNLDAAATALRNAMQREKTTETAIKLHGVLTAQGKTAEAARLEASWTAEWPRDEMFRFHLGDIATMRSEWATAETHYRAVIGIQPDHAQAHNNLAWAMLQQKKDGALQIAEKAHQLLPKNPSVMDTLAAAQAASGQLPKAMETQKAALALFPDNANLRLGLARIALKAGDKTLARSELEKLAYLGDKFAKQAEVSEMLRSLQ